MSATINSSGVVFLDATQTTSNMNTFAGHSVGAVGSYALLRPNGSVSYNRNGYGSPMGTNIAGSGLYYTNAWGLAGNWNGYSGTSPAGTWKLLGTSQSADSTNGWNATLWVRIS